MSGELAQGVVQERMREAQGVVQEQMFAELAQGVVQERMSAELAQGVVQGQMFAELAQGVVQEQMFAELAQAAGALLLLIACEYTSALSDGWQHYLYPDVAPQLRPSYSWKPPF